MFRKSALIFALWSLNISGAFAAPGESDSAADAPAAAEEWFNLEAELAAAAASTVEEPFQKLWTAQEHVRLHSGLAVSRNGKRVLAFTRPEGWIVYDGDDGRVVCRNEKTSGLICSAISIDGSRGALGCRDGTIRIIDLETGAELRRYAANVGDPLTVHLAEDGKFVTWLESGGKLVRASLSDEPTVTLVCFDETRKERPKSMEEAFSMLSRLSVWNHTFSFDGETIGFVPIPTSRTLAVHSFLPSNAQGFSYNRTLSAALRNIAFGRNMTATFTEIGELAIIHECKTIGKNPTVAAHPVRNTVGAGGASSLSISSDEKWVMFAAGGQVDLRTVDCPNFSTIHRAETDDAALLAAAPDVRRLAAIDSRGFVSLHELAKSPDSPARRLRQSIGRLYQEARFADLDRFAAAIQNDPETFEWNRYVSNFVAFKGMVKGEALRSVQAAQRFRDWKTTIPESKLVRYIMAEEAIEEAWQARGSGFANTVSRTGWEKFTTRLFDAEEALRPVIDGPAPPPDAFAKWFEISKGASRSNREMQPYVQKLMEVGPEFRYPHYAMCERLLERWGGTFEASAQYAATVANKVGGGKGDALYAAMAGHITNYYRDDFFDQTTFEYDRIQAGNRFLMEQPKTLSRGIAAAFMFASIKNDRETLKELKKRIETERIPYDPNSFPARTYYEFALLQACDGYEPEPQPAAIGPPGKIDPRMLEKLREEIERMQKNPKQAPVDPETT